MRCVLRLLSKTTQTTDQHQSPVSIPFPSPPSALRYIPPPRSAISCGLGVIASHGQDEDPAAEASDELSHTPPQLLHFSFLALAQKPAESKSLTHHLPATESSATPSPPPPAELRGKKRDSRLFYFLTRVTLLQSAAWTLPGVPSGCLWLFCNHPHNPSPGPQASPPPAFWRHNPPASSARLLGLPSFLPPPSGRAPHHDRLSHTRLSLRLAHTPLWNLFSSLFIFCPPASSLHTFPPYEFYELPPHKGSRIRQAQVNRQHPIHRRLPHAEPDPSSALFVVGSSNTAAAPRATSRRLLPKRLVDDELQQHLCRAADTSDDDPAAGRVRCRTAAPAARRATSPATNESPGTRPTPTQLHRVVPSRPTASSRRPARRRSPPARSSDRRPRHVPARTRPSPQDTPLADGRRPPANQHRRRKPPHRRPPSPSPGPRRRLPPARRPPPAARSPNERWSPPSGLRRASTAPRPPAGLPAHRRSSAPASLPEKLGRRGRGREQEQGPAYCGH